MPRDDSGVRLAEVLAAMSIATDLGMGQPVETALQTCVVATRLADAAGASRQDRADVYQLALLRYIGCNAETHAMAALFGDELALRKDFAVIDPGRIPDVLDIAARHIRQASDSTSPEVLEGLVTSALQGLPALMHEAFSGHCEVAQRLAARLGLGDSLIACLGQLYERWDGRGQPRGLQGEEVAPAVLFVTLAQDAVLWSRIGGTDGARTTVLERAGGAYPAWLADRFAADAGAFLAGLETEAGWDAVLALEPKPHRVLSEAELDRACEALADFADLKSPYCAGRSHAVAALAAGAGRRAGLAAEDVHRLRRAALMQDVGRAGVSARVWAKAGPLSDGEREQVRLHPYYTERVLARPEALRAIAALACQHHERMDGSGYHRGLAGRDLTLSARILGAADTYQALLERRPHRPHLTAEAAADELRREQRAGRLDADAVHAVLAEAGHAVPSRRRDRPAGLSGREVEVLRLIAHGRSNREVAELLVIAPDTVKHHIRHIYDKVGVSTRAGATLFAMENALV